MFIILSVIPTVYSKRSKKTMASPVEQAELPNKKYQKLTSKEKWKFRRWDKWINKRAVKKGEIPESNYQLPADRSERREFRKHYNQIMIIIYSLTTFPIS